MEEKKQERTEAQITAECQRLVLELGQKEYQSWLLQKDIEQAKKAIYALNVEAYKLRAAQISNEVVSDG